MTFCQKVVNTAGGISLRGAEESEEESFWRLENFLKLKTAFCEYWTSIKIKISMICVLKEYEIKTNKNGTGTITTAKNVFIFLLGWIDFWWEGIKIWWGGNQ